MCTKKHNKLALETLLGNITNKLHRVNKWNYYLFQWKQNAKFSPSFAAAQRNLGNIGRLRKVAAEAWTEGRCGAEGVGGAAQV